MNRLQPQASTSKADVHFDSDTHEDDDDVKLASEVGKLDEELALISHYEKVVLGHQNAEETQPESDLEAALALNRKLERQVRLLEKHLTEKLSYCEARLAKLDECLVSNEPTARKKLFKFVVCGYPYFKDKDLFAAAPNEDAVRMKNAGMFSFHRERVRNWSDKDKTMLEKIMLEESRRIRAKEISREINDLKRLNRDSNLLHTNDAQIADLQRRLAEVDNLPIDRVALPIDRNYDWDLIADRMPKLHPHSANEVRNIWRLFFHPDINKKPWTKGEREKLKTLVGAHNQQDWDAIAQELKTKRSAFQCFIYYKSEIQKSHNGEKWTPEEDAYLREVIKACRIGEYIPWSKVKYFIGNKTRKQIYNRYCDSVLLKKQGLFSPEEDKILWACMKRYGLNIRRFKHALPSRTVRQIRQRCLSLKESHSNWSRYDDQKLLKLMKKHEHSRCPFSEITKHFRNRSRAQLRRRFIVLERWLKLNPNTPVVHAPSRFPKNYAEIRTKLENATKDLNVEELLLSTKETIEYDKIKTDNISLDQKEKKYQRDLVHSRLLAFFIAEETKKRLGETACNPDDTVDVLRVLKADLNEKSLDNLKSDEFPDADSLCRLWATPEPVQTMVIHKTYGRKTAPESDPPLADSDDMLLPLNRQNIIGMKALLSYIYSHADLFRSRMRKHFVRKVDEKNETVKLWLQRFQSLFYWPILTLNTRCLMENTFEDVDIANDNQEID